MDHLLSMEKDLFYYGLTDLNNFA